MSFNGQERIKDNKAMFIFSNNFINQKKNIINSNQTKFNQFFLHFLCFFSFGWFLSSSLDCSACSSYGFLSSSESSFHILPISREISPNFQSGCSSLTWLRFSATKKLYADLPILKMKWRKNFLRSWREMSLFTSFFFFVNTF